MELKKANKSWCYKQGFKKGIEISNNNHREHGYFADEENEKIIRSFLKQINELPLTFSQAEWRKGVIDGIYYTYNKFGTTLKRKEESPFEKYQRIHDYGERKPYNGTNYWE